MIRKQQKFKHNIISPEDVVPNKLLTFSFNPEEQPLFQKFYTMKLNNLKDWSQQINNIISSMKYCKITAYLEISRKSRLHLHGFINITHIIKFYLCDLKKLMHYGTLEIDIINDNEIWTKYVLKQEKMMQSFAKNNDMYYEYGYSLDSLIGNDI